MFRWPLIPVLMFGLATLSWSHTDSLRLNGVLVGTKTASFAGGQTFTAGQQVTVTWRGAVAHNGTRIYFRFQRTTGTVWDTISSTTTMGGTGLHTFMWTIPAGATTQAKFKLYQALSPNPELNTPDDYNLISGIFAIQNPSNINPASLSPGLSFRQTANAIQIGASGDFRGLRVELSDVRGVLLREGRLLDSGPMAISTSGLTRGRVFLRVWSDDKSLANRAFLIQH